jgi:hypothetical protein
LSRTAPVPPPPLTGSAGRHEYPRSFS